MSVLTWWDGSWPTTRFIETGTGLGDTTKHVLRRGVGRLDTIEADRRLYDMAVFRFGAWSHVGVHFGRSEDVLPGLLRDEPTTFWLDAHWSGGYLDERYVRPECPVLAELAVIRAFDWHNPRVVLVDDAFMFEGWPWGAYWDGPLAGGFDRAQWPSMGEVIGMMHGYEVVLRRLEGVVEFRCGT